MVEQTMEPPLHQQAQADLLGCSWTGDQHGQRLDWTTEVRTAEQRWDGEEQGVGKSGWETASADRPSQGRAESKPLGSLTRQGASFKLYFEPLNTYYCRSAWLARTLPFRNPQRLEGDWQSHVWMEAPTFPSNLLALWDLLLGFFSPLYNLVG